MDCRAVPIFLYVLIAQTSCGPIQDATKIRARNATIQLMQGEIHAVLKILEEPGLLPNISCPSMNIKELGDLEQQPLTTHHLPSFRCYVLKISKHTPELSGQLNNISQYAQDLELLINGQTTQVNCSLDPFSPEMKNYLFVRCLLQILDRRLSKAEI